MLWDSRDNGPTQVKRVDLMGFHRQLRMGVLVIGSVGALLLGLGILLAMLFWPCPMRAEYESGVGFNGMWSLTVDYGFHYVNWRQSPQHPRCPIRVSLPRLQLGEAQLGSPAAMRAVGAEISPVPAGSWASLEQDDFRVTTFYDGKDNLTMMSVQAPTSGSSKATIHIDGTSMPLPVSQRELIRRLGTPQWRQLP